MPYGNDILTADVIAREAITTLYANTVMANLVYRGVEADWSGDVLGHAKGDTITVRKPTVFTADEFDRAAGIQLQDIEEEGIPVKLDTIADVSFSVTSEELTLDITQFASRLLVPAMEALAQKIDKDLLALRYDVTASVEFGTAWDTVIDVRKTLNKAKVPFPGRAIVWGSELEGDVLKDARFTTANQTGDGGTRFSEAQVGRAAGFDHFLDQNVDDTDESVAFHPWAFTLATRPLYLPEGAADAAQASWDGISVRVVRDYDTNKKEQIVSVDVLYGVKTLDAARAVIIEPGS